MELTKKPSNVNKLCWFVHFSCEIDNRSQKDFISAHVRAKSAGSMCEFVACREWSTSA